MHKLRRWVPVVVAVFAIGTALCTVGESRASAAGNLTFADCVGSGAGCIATGGPQASASSLAVSNNGKALYAGFGDGTFGGISRFSISSTGTLSYTDCISSGSVQGKCSVTSTNDPGALESPSDIAISPNDRSLYVDDSKGFVDHLFAFPDQGGKLQWDGCVSGDGSAGHCASAGRPLNPLSDPLGIAVSPDGGSVYVAGTMSNGQPNGLEGVTTHFLANADQGQLTFDGCVNNDGAGNSCGPIPGAPFGIQAEGLAISPGGGIYVGGLNGVAHFTPTTGAGMPFSDCMSNDGSGGACTKAPGLGIFSITRTLVMSSDGKQLYALTTSGGVDHLAVGADGRMTFADCISDDGTSGTCSGLPVPGGLMFDLTDIAISPDGTSLYAVSSKRASITEFNIGASGTLTFNQCLTAMAVTGCTTVPQISGIDRIMVSPDSKSVYVTAIGSILHFNRATSSSGTGSGSTGTGSTGTGTGSTGTGTTTGTVSSGGGTVTRTVNTTTGNLKLSFSLQSASTCTTAASTLHPKLSVTAIPKSKATKWTFGKASLFVDRGVRQVHHVTVRQHGKNVTVTKITFAANQTLAKPGAAPLKLKGLKKGSHALALQVLLHRPAQSGSKVMLSTTKTLRTSFKVC